MRMAVARSTAGIVTEGETLTNPRARLYFTVIFIFIPSAICGWQ
jgi:hypothetical protein